MSGPSNYNPVDDPWARYNELQGRAGPNPSNAGVQGFADASTRAVPQFQLCYSIRMDHSNRCFILVSQCRLQQQLAGRFTEL